MGPEDNQSFEPMADFTPEIGFDAMAEEQRQIQERELQLHNQEVGREVGSMGGADFTARFSVLYTESKEFAGQVDHLVNDFVSSVITTPEEKSDFMRRVDEADGNTKSYLDILMDMAGEKVNASDNQRQAYADFVSEIKEIKATAEAMDSRIEKYQHYVEAAPVGFYRNTFAAYERFQALATAYEHKIPMDIGNGERAVPSIGTVLSSFLAFTNTNILDTLIFMAVESMFPAEKVEIETKDVEVRADEKPLTLESAINQVSPNGVVVDKDAREKLSTTERNEVMEIRRDHKQFGRVGEIDVLRNPMSSDQLLRASDRFDVFGIPGGKNGYSFKCESDSIKLDYSPLTVVIDNKEKNAYLCDGRGVVKEHLQIESPAAMFSVGDKISAAVQPTAGNDRHFTKHFNEYETHLCDVYIGRDGDISNRANALMDDKTELKTLKMSLGDIQGKSVFMIAAGMEKIDERLSDLSAMKDDIDDFKALDKEYQRGTILTRISHERDGNVNYDMADIRESVKTDIEKHNNDMEKSQDDVAKPESQPDNAENPGISKDVSNNDSTSKDVEVEKDGGDVDHPNDVDNADADMEKFTGNSEATEPDEVNPVDTDVGQKAEPVEDTGNDIDEIPPEIPSEKDGGDHAERPESKENAIVGEQIEENGLAGGAMTSDTYESFSSLAEDIAEDTRSAPERLADRISEAAQPVISLKDLDMNDKGAIEARFETAKEKIEIEYDRVSEIEVKLDTKEFALKAEAVECVHKGKDAAEIEAALDDIRDCKESISLYIDQLEVRQGVMDKMDTPDEKLEELDRLSKVNADVFPADMENRIDSVIEDHKAELEHSVSVFNEKDGGEIPLTVGAVLDPDIPTQDYSEAVQSDYIAETIRPELTERIKAYLNDNTMSFTEDVITPLAGELAETIHDVVGESVVKVLTSEYAIVEKKGYFDADGSRIPALITDYLRFAEDGESCAYDRLVTEVPGLEFNDEIVFHLGNEDLRWQDTSDTYTNESVVSIETRTDTGVESTNYLFYPEGVFRINDSELIATTPAEMRECIVGIVKDCFGSGIAREFNDDIANKVGDFLDNSRDVKIAIDQALYNTLPNLLMEAFDGKEIEIEQKDEATDQNETMKANIEVVPDAVGISSDTATAFELDSNMEEISFSDSDRMEGL